MSVSQLVTFFINKFASQYLEGVDAKDLNISLRSDVKVELDNLCVKADVLSQIHPAIVVRRGIVGHLRVLLPWTEFIAKKKISQKPTLVEIENIYLLASPRSDVALTAEDIAAKLQKELTDRIAALAQDEITRVSRMKQEIFPSQGGINSAFIRRAMLLAVANLEVRVRNIHIRIEDCDPVEPVAIGVTLGRFDICSADRSWNVTRVAVGKDGNIDPDCTDEYGRFFKTLEIERLGAYIDTSFVPFTPLIQRIEAEKPERRPNMALKPNAAKFMDLMACGINHDEPAGSVADHHYVLKPFSLSLHLKVTQDFKPSSDGRVPGVEADLELPQVLMDVTTFQCSSLLSRLGFLAEFGTYSGHLKYRPARRPRDVQNKYGEDGEMTPEYRKVCAQWLRYAGCSVLEQQRREREALRLNRGSAEFSNIVQLAVLRNRYIEPYLAHLGCQGHRDLNDQLLQSIDRDPAIPLSQIQHIRRLAFLELEAVLKKDTKLAEKWFDSYESGKQARMSEERKGLFRRSTSSKSLDQNELSELYSSVGFDDGDAARATEQSQHVLVRVGLKLGVVSLGFGVAHFDVDPPSSPIGAGQGLSWLGTRSRQAMILRCVLARMSGSVDKAVGPGLDVKAAVGGLWCADLDPEDQQLRYLVRVFQERITPDMVAAQTGEDPFARMIPRLEPSMQTYLRMCRSSSLVSAAFSILDPTLPTSDVSMRVYCRLLPLLVMPAPSLVSRLLTAVKDLSMQPAAIVRRETAPYLVPTTGTATGEQRLRLSRRAQEVSANYEVVSKFSRTRLNSSASSIAGALRKHRAIGLDVALSAPTIIVPRVSHGAISSCLTVDLGSFSMKSQTKTAKERAQLEAAAASRNKGQLTALAYDRYVVRVADMRVFCALSYEDTLLQLTGCDVSVDTIAESLSLKLNLGVSQVPSAIEIPFTELTVTIPPVVLRLSEDSLGKLVDIAGCWLPQFMKATELTPVVVVEPEVQIEQEQPRVQLSAVRDAVNGTLGSFAATMTDAGEEYLARIADFVITHVRVDFQGVRVEFLWNIGHQLSTVAAFALDRISADVAIKPQSQTVSLNVGAFSVTSPSAATNSCVVSSIDVDGNDLIQSGAAQVSDLLQVTVDIVSEASPRYQGVGMDILAKVGGVHLAISPAVLANLLNFAQTVLKLVSRLQAKLSGRSDTVSQATSARTRAPKPVDTVPEYYRVLRRAGLLPAYALSAAMGQRKEGLRPEKLSMRLNATVQGLRVTMYHTNELPLLAFQVSNLGATVELSEGAMQLNMSLSSITLNDLRLSAPEHQRCVLSTPECSDMVRLSLLSCTPASPLWQGYKLELQGHIQRMEIMLLGTFIGSILPVVNVLLASLQSLTDTDVREHAAALINETVHNRIEERREENSAPKPPAVCPEPILIDLVVEAPHIVVPRQAGSKMALEVNLGRVEVQGNVSTVGFVGQGKIPLQVYHVALTDFAVQSDAIQISGLDVTVAMPLPECGYCTEEEYNALPQVGVNVLLPELRARVTPQLFDLAMDCVQRNILVGFPSSPESSETKEPSKHSRARTIAKTIATQATRSLIREFTIPPQFAWGSRQKMAVQVTGGYFSIMLAGERGHGSTGDVLAQLIISNLSARVGMSTAGDISVDAALDGLSLRDARSSRQVIRPFRRLLSAGILPHEDGQTSAGSSAHSEHSIQALIAKITRKHDGALDVTAALDGISVMLNLESILAIGLFFTGPMSLLPEQLDCHDEPMTADMPDLCDFSDIESDLDEIPDFAEEPVRAPSVAITPEAEQHVPTALEPLRQAQPTPLIMKTNTRIAVAMRRLALVFVADPTSDQSQAVSLSLGIGFDYSMDGALEDVTLKARDISVAVTQPALRHRAEFQQRFIVTPVTLGVHFAHDLTEIVFPQEEEEQAEETQEEVLSKKELRRIKKQQKEQEKREKRERKEREKEEKERRRKERKRAAETESEDPSFVEEVVQIPATDDTATAEEPAPEEELAERVPVSRYDTVDVTVAERMNIQVRFVDILFVQRVALEASQRMKEYVEVSKRASEARLRSLGKEPPGPPPVIETPVLADSPVSVAETPLDTLPERMEFPIIPVPVKLKAEFNGMSIQIIDNRDGQETPLIRAQLSELLVKARTAPYIKFKMLLCLDAETFNSSLHGWDSMLEPTHLRLTFLEEQRSAMLKFLNPVRLLIGSGTLSSLCSTVASLAVDITSLTSPPSSPIEENGDQSFVDATSASFSDGGSEVDSRDDEEFALAAQAFCFIINETASNVQIVSTTGYQAEGEETPQQEPFIQNCAAGDTSELPVSFPPAQSSSDAHYVSVQVAGYAATPAFPIDRSDEFVLPLVPTAPILAPTSLAVCVTHRGRTSYVHLGSLFTVRNATHSDQTLFFRDPMAAVPTMCERTVPAGEAVCVPLYMAASPELFMSSDIRATGLRLGAYDNVTASSAVNARQQASDVKHMGKLTYEEFFLQGGKKIERLDDRVSGYEVVHSDPRIIQPLALFPAGPDLQGDSLFCFEHQERLLCAPGAEKPVIDATVYHATAIEYTIYSAVSVTNAFPMTVHVALGDVATNIEPGQTFAFSAQPRESFLFQCHPLITGATGVAFDVSPQKPLPVSFPVRIEETEMHFGVDAVRHDCGALEFTLYAPYVLHNNAQELKLKLRKGTKSLKFTTTPGTLVLPFSRMPKQTQPGIVTEKKALISFSLGDSEYGDEFCPTTTGLSGRIALANGTARTQLTIRVHTSPDGRSNTIELDPLARLINSTDTALQVQVGKTIVDAPAGADIIVPAPLADQPSTLQLRSGNGEWTDPLVFDAPADRVTRIPGAGYARVCTVQENEAVTMHVETVVPAPQRLAENWALGELNESYAPLHGHDGAPLVLPYVVSNMTSFGVHIAQAEVMEDMALGPHQRLAFALPKPDGELKLELSFDIPELTPDQLRAAKLRRPPAKATGTVDLTLLRRQDPIEIVPNLFTVLVTADGLGPAVHVQLVETSTVETEASAFQRKMKLRAIASGRAGRVSQRKLKKMNAATASEQSDELNMTFVLKVPEISVSLVNTYPREFANIELVSLRASVEMRTGGVALDLRLMGMQIDNTDARAQFPVALAVLNRSDMAMPPGRILHGRYKMQTRVAETQSQRNKDANVKAAVKQACPCVLLKAGIRHTASGLLYIQTLQLCVQEIVVSVDSVLMSNFIDFMLLVSNATNLLPKGPTVTKAPSRVFIETLAILPIRVQATFDIQGFIVTVRTNPMLAPLIPFIAVFSMLAQLSDATLSFGALVLADNFAAQSALVHTIVNFYLSRALTQLFRVVGSLSLIGNPAGLITSIGGGVIDLFAEPFEAIQGVADGTLNAAAVARGFGRGALGLVKGATSGVAGTVAGITGGISTGLTAITGDRRYEEARNRRQRLAQEGGVSTLQASAGAVADGFASAFTGLVTAPQEGFEQGFGQGMLGIARGLAGLVVKPVTGVLDAVSTGFEGIRTASGAGIFTVRPARGFTPRGEAVMICDQPELKMPK